MLCIGRSYSRKRKKEGRKNRLKHHIRDGKYRRHFLDWEMGVVYRSKQRQEAEEKERGKRSSIGVMYR